MKTFKELITELSKPKELGSVKSTLKAKVTSVDTRNTSWSMSLTDVMGKYGFKTVGSGKYATVYINPSYKWALKVFMRDSAYQRWISFSLKNQSNPYVPKIRGKVVKITPLVYAIRLEKLTPYKSGESSSKFMTDFASWKRDPNFMSDDKNIQDVLNHFAKNKKLLDLHGENMMMRGNQIVIIDPYYNWFGKRAPGEYSIDPNELDTSLF